MQTMTQREIVVARTYDAPRDLVWRAWTEPDRLAQWWGKRGWNADQASLVMDVRPGGAFSITSVCEEDGSEMTQRGVYREVLPPVRLVFEADHGAVSTVTFAEAGAGRTEVVLHASVEMSEALALRAEAGTRSAFDRLAEVLAR